MTHRDMIKANRPMTAEIALLRGMLALNERIAHDPSPDERDIEAMRELQRILEQRGMDELEPGCVYLHEAIDVWVHG